MPPGLIGGLLELLGLLGLHKIDSDWLLKSEIYQIRNRAIRDKYTTFAYRAHN